MTTNNTLAVIGAGNMGSGIAQKIASEGFQVMLVDLDDAALERGMNGIRTTLSDAIERKIMTEQAVADTLERVHPTVDWSLLKDAELVIEAVFENLEVKQDVFRRLSDVTAPDAILATNTSSFYVRDVASVCDNPGRVVGLHYFYHPAKNRLVEVVPTEGTNRSAFRRAWDIQEAMGKTPIACHDSPGFIVNRYFVPWINEAVRLLEEGVADIPTIEAAAKKAFRIGMGPFELMNVTGVPIALHAASTLGRELGDLYAPAARLKEQVEKGGDWDLLGDPGTENHDTIADRLLGVTFLIASEIVEEGVGSVEDTDIGARVGLRWANGPFELMNRTGIGRSAELAQAVADQYDRKLPATLANQVQSNVPFRFELVQTEVQGDVATLSINRPDAMNAINVDVVGQLRQAFDAANHDPDVRTIVIAGKGKGFIAGADIRFFVRNIESDNIGAIDKFTRDGHELLDAFSTSEKVVIARLDGLSLGGGCEIALACDWIVATPRGTMGFPETGIGIYPGLGGTQRLPRRIGIPLARWLVLSGSTVDAKTGQSMGLVDLLVPHEGLGDAIQELSLRGKAHRDTGGPDSPPAGFESLWKIFETGDLESLMSLDHEAMEDKMVSRSLKALSFKAPLALRIADKLVSNGTGVSLSEGLEMELSHLEEIFRTKDALEGLSSLGRSRPTFTGE